ncbi:hypothetical protein HAV15_010650 [Penicillium sp. str. |nr:hypothetical protein HAV15_010650 [Penicillium sp. str. \
MAEKVFKMWWKWTVAREAESAFYLAQKSRPAPAIQATAFKRRDNTSFTTTGCSSPATIPATLADDICDSSIGRMMQHLPRSGECAVFSLLARITVACFRGSPIGCGETGEADDDDRWEVEALANKRPSVNLRR